MAKRVQIIRHITADANLFTGLDGEVTMDLTARELRLHDGITIGGVATARKDLANVDAATSTQDGKMTAAYAALLETAWQTPAYTVGNVVVFDANGDPADGGTTISGDYVAKVGAQTMEGPLTVTGAGAGLGQVFIEDANTYFKYTVAGGDHLSIVQAVGYIDICMYWQGGIASNAFTSDEGSTWHKFNAADESHRIKNNLYGIQTQYNAGATADPIVWTTLFEATNLIIEYQGNTIWHAGNDGTGSGLDADTVDGQEAVIFAYRANNLSDLASAATARTNLGLGSLAVLSTINNSNWSGADLAVVNGGTGKSNSADALLALGVFTGELTDAGVGTILPAGWSSVRNSVGYYTITHTIGSILFRCSVICNSATLSVAVTVLRTTTTIQIRVRDTTTGALTDAFTEFLGVVTP